MTQQDADQQIADALTQITAHNANIALWTALLSADAASATQQTDYSLDGESYSREGYRRALIERIRTTTEVVQMLRDGIVRTQQLVNQLFPYVLATKQVMR